MAFPYIFSEWNVFRCKGTIEPIHVLLKKLVVTETVLTNIQQVTFPILIGTTDILRFFVSGNVVG
jgi:hypothetical protein